MKVYSLLSNPTVAAELRTYVWLNKWAMDPEKLAQLIGISSLILQQINICDISLTWKFHAVLYSIWKLNYFPVFTSNSDEESH